jgi:hypothetical protein
MADDLIKNPTNFSRVGKLLTIFGYGQLAPYNANALKMALNPSNRDKRMASGKTVRDWYQERVADGQSFQQQLQDWSEMVNYSPIAAGIRIIVEECLQTEAASPATLWVEGGDTETEKELNEFIVGRLQMEDVIRAQFKAVISYGNDFERLHLGPEGIHGWHFRDVEKVERFSDEFKRLIGYVDEEEPPSPTPEAVIWGDENDPKRLHKPWDFIHFRLMMDDRKSDYGQSLLKPAVQTYKRLRMAEDQMSIYRLQMQPTRYLVKIDTGTASVPEVWRMVNQWINKMRTNRLIDARNQQYEPRNNPWSIDDIIVLPTHKDSQSDLRKLDGDHDIPDIEDIQYLLRQLGSMLNIPPEYLGAQPEQNQGLSPKSPLYMQDLRFQRSIKTVRAVVMQGYDKACRLHLALLGKNPFLPFRVKMSNIVALEAESQIELLTAQATLADQVIALGTNIQAPKEEWLRMVFTKFFPLPPELVDIIAIGALMPPAGGAEGAGGAGGAGGGGMPGLGGGEEGGELGVPGGPELDLGAAAGGAGGAAPPGGGGGAPAAPGEAFDPDPVKRRKALLEWRLGAARWHARYFSFEASAKRYLNRNGKELNESSLNEAKRSLTETRRKLWKLGDTLRYPKENVSPTDQKLYESAQRLSSLWGRIVHVLDGYTPDWQFLRDYQHYLTEYRGRGDAKPTRFVLENRYENTVKPDANDPNATHEILTVLTESRKRRNNSNNNGHRPLTH